MEKKLSPLETPRSPGIATMILPQAPMPFTIPMIIGLHLYKCITT